MYVRVVFALVLTLALAGCATTDGYGQFFTMLPGVDPASIVANRAAPAPPVPEVVHFDGPFDRAAQIHYMEQGYVLLGYSSFTSGYRQSDSDAAKQGAIVDADLVIILSSSFSRSITTAVPWTTPTATTSYTTGTATAYGPAGAAVAYGSSTTTTYGTNTTNLPMTVNRFQYGALYFVKEHAQFGVMYRDLTDEERQELQSNHGVYVTVVVNGTPAYQSDILPGDIITEIDGIKVDDSASIGGLLESHAGQTVRCTIVRQGEVMSKDVALGQ